MTNRIELMLLMGLIAALGFLITACDETGTGESGNKGTDSTTDSVLGVDSNSDSIGNLSSDSLPDSDSASENPVTDTASGATGGTDSFAPGDRADTDTPYASGDTTDTGIDTTDSVNTAPTDTSANQYGIVHEGMYHLGPVDFAETEWHNACAPAGGYRSVLQASTGLGGEYLAGLATEYSEKGGTCDACILIQTALGNSIVARVVTYGTEKDAGDIDVSPSVYAAINEDEWPRTMTWEFASCPDTGTLYYEFQTEANIWWTSLWVRNPKVPIEKVEVKSSKHSDYIELTRGTDGTLTDKSGFGDGPFTLRITAMDGQIIEDTLNGFDPGELITSTKQFN
ncbi:MAG: hypothetical protein JXR76_02655 [Deltaproteobacteria bacterium]|nr:hypothetical protein [Deltaproteobacteria bacterium]